MYRLFNSVLITVLGVASLVQAAPAPRLSTALSASANPLQRAAWACEGGAGALLPAPDPKSGRARYFLSGAGEAATDEPPLSLTGRTLTGFGWLNDDRGWSVIQFHCGLSPDLRKAASFSLSVIAKAAAPAGDPTESTTLDPAPARDKVWRADPKGLALSYGAPETADVDVFATCQPATGQAEVVLGRTVPWLKKDGYVVVTLGDGAHSGMYVARGRVNAQASAAMPVVSMLTSDPLLTWLAGGKALSINIGRDVAYSIPLAGAAEPAKAFSSTCRRGNEPLQKRDVATSSKGSGNSRR